LLFGYLIGWVITTIGVAVIIGKLNEPVRPQRYVIPLTVAAGVAWPLVILGAAQMAILVLVMRQLDIGRDVVDGPRARRSTSCPTNC
jgi:biotin transporter BioY